MIYPIEPCPKPRMTRRDKWANRSCVLRYRQFKDECRARGVTLPQPCKVVFYIEMPKSWSAHDRRVNDQMPHQRKPDLDNLLKALCDAVLKDDSKIWNVRAEKRWSYAAGIEITPLETE